MLKPTYSLLHSESKRNTISYKGNLVQVTVICVKEIINKKNYFELINGIPMLICINIVYILSMLKV